jgi:hypothetical protein
MDALVAAGAEGYELAVRDVPGWDPELAIVGRGGWRRWLPLVLFDRDMLELYAARVAGGLILADQRLRLLGALFRHMFLYGSRQRQLAALGWAVTRRAP